MDHRKKHPIDFTDEQMKKIEAFANANAMTVDEAASFMASAELRARYTKPRKQSKVIQLHRGAAK